MPPKKKQKLHHVSSSSSPSKKPPPLRVDVDDLIWITKPESIEKLITWKNKTFIVSSSFIFGTSIESKQHEDSTITLSKKIEFQNCNFDGELFNLVWCPERAELYCFDVEDEQVIVFNLNTNTEVTYQTDKWYKSTLELTGGYDSVSQKIVLVNSTDKKLTYSLFDIDKKEFDFVDKEMPIRGTVSASAARTKSRQLYVYGELQGESAQEAGGQLQSCLWCYNFATDSWSTVKVTGGAVPKFRLYPAFAIQPGNDQMFALLYGGQYEDAIGNWFHDWWQFHFDTCQWSRIVNHSHFRVMKYPIISFVDQQNALLIDSAQPNDERPHRHVASITISMVQSKECELSERTFPRVHKMHEDPKFTDVHVMLKDGSVDLHRFVLAIDPSIDQMVTSSLASVSTESTCLPFLLDLRDLDIPLRIFKTYMVEFMYRGKPSKIKIDDMIDVIGGSKVLRLWGLYNHSVSIIFGLFRRPLAVTQAVNLALSIFQHKSASSYLELVKAYFQSLNSEKRAAFVEQVVKHQSQISKEVMVQLLTWSTAEVIPFGIAHRTHPQSGRDNGLLDNYFDIYLTDRENSVKVGAHKALLVVTSDYFKSLILGSFQESIQLQHNSSSATTTTSTTTSGSVVDDSSNVLALDCSAEALQLFKGYIYGQPVKIPSSSTVDEYLDLLFDLIRLFDQLMIDGVRSIIGVNLKQLTADRLFEFYDLTQDIQVWNLILNTFDSEDLRLMYSSGSLKFSTAVNHETQNENE